jgi:hypothetical protein
MTFEEFYQRLNFEEETEWAYGRVCITGRLAMQAKDWVDLALFSAHEDEARDFHRRSIAKRIWDMVRREIAGRYSVDDLRMAYEMGARDGMVSGWDRFDAVREIIDKRKGNA